MADRRVLGLDVGGVLIARTPKAQRGAPDTFFSDRYLESPEEPGAFLAVVHLVPTFDEVHLVSKAGANTRRKTIEWLAYRRFWTTTGVPVANLHTCLTRPEKAPICARLGVTHFVDDRLDVLNAMAGIVAVRILYVPATSRHQPPADCGGVIVARSWGEVEAACAPGSR